MIKQAELAGWESIPDNHPAVTFITDFADQAVILPLVFAIGIALLVQGWRRGAAAWTLAVLATFATMLVLKLVFMACATSFDIASIHTPSGHVAAATVVTGGLTTVLRRRRGAVVPLALVAALVIGVSRLALGVHSLPEVVLGALVGLAGARLLVRLAGPPPPDINGWRIAAIAILTVIVFHGLHLPAEAHIRATAYRMAKMLAVCQSEVVRL
jgi:membrane-associated phospholipid phosphatase